MSFMRYVAVDVKNRAPIVTLPGSSFYQIESYLKLFGCYPESVHADKICHNPDNRRYCKKHKI